MARERMRFISKRVEIDRSEVQAASEVVASLCILKVM
jgi:hypothetical protein